MVSRVEKVHFHNEWMYIKNIKKEKIECSSDFEINHENLHENYEAEREI